jgi:hypothetical protein
MIFRRQTANDVFMTLRSRKSLQHFAKPENTKEAID